MDSAPHFIGSGLFRRGLRGGWLLDPACGDGAFLEEAVRLFIQKAQEAGWPPAAISEALSERIWGIDIDEAAVEKARERLTALTQALGLPLPTWRLQKGDAIDPFWMATHRGRFRYVVGNPPYVRIQHLGERGESTCKNTSNSAKAAVPTSTSLF